MKTNRKHLFATAVSLPLALGVLTACGAGQGSIKVEGSAGPAGVASAGPTTAPPASSPEPSVTKAAPRTTTTTTRPATKATTPKKSTAIPACTAANTKLTVTSMSRPINHVLISAKNIGSSSCYAYYAPDVYGGNTFKTLKESAPSSPVRLAPGHTAHAVLGTSAGDGSGKHGVDVLKLSIQFVGKGSGEAVGAMRAVAVPSPPLYVDDSAFVTYWQPEGTDLTQW